MLVPVTSHVREFLASWKNLLALGTLPILAAWIFSRVWMVNPAILGDEYIYSMNARKVGPWDPPIAGDFSNYLFNFVYQSTNLCGDSFYTCGKVLNIVFFCGFIFTMFVTALRFLPFWGAYAFMVVAAVSPLSVYTSMFLPESMYFFAIGLVLVSVLRAMENYSAPNWSIVGVALGITSLIKPHAWLSAIAIGIVLLVVGLSNKEIGLRGTFRSLTGVVLGSLLSRIVLGLLVAGPKALDFFGQYLEISTVETLLEGANGEPASAEIPAQTPLDGVASLFGPQLFFHSQVIIAIMGISVVGLIAGILNLVVTRQLNFVSAFSLFVFIWLTSMVLEIVIFTGWITGGGDDHSTRLLSRYYDYLFVIGPLAGLSGLTSNLGEKVHVAVRWGLVIMMLVGMTSAFTGTFGLLTIQIADTPTLAGLVVSREVFDAAAVLGAGTLMLFATFPRWSPWGFVALLPVTLAATGWQAQDQYQIARGTPNASDLGGQRIAQEFSDSELSETWIIGTSRFEVTGAALWADNASLRYEAFISGSQVDQSYIPSGISRLLVIGDVTYVTEAEPILEGEGYKVYVVD